MKSYLGILTRRKEIIGRNVAAFKPLGVEVLVHYTDNHQSFGYLYITRILGADMEKRQQIIVKMAERAATFIISYFR